MKRLNYLKWWLALVLCGLAAGVLVPLSLATVWLARQARAGEDRADIELLCATAQRRMNRGRKT